MDQLLYSNKTRGGRRHSSGFTLIEVLVATIVFLIGIVAAAAVVGSTLGNTARSQYMTQAATVATEKLEDLNRYAISDAHVVVPNGVSAGGLTSDVLNNVTTNGVTVPINYYDEVYFSPAAGALVETGSSLDAMGDVQYQTITYTPDGQIQTSAFSTTPPGGSGTIGFERRWIIEQDVPVVGVRRVTVLVTLLNQSVTPPVTFQMSMVRP